MTWTINAVQGGTITRRLTLTNDDGTLVNTTGWTFRAGIRGSYLQALVQVTLVSQGVIELHLPATQTVLFEPGVYTLGIDWTDALGGTPEEEIRAVVNISRDAAR